MIHCSHRQGQQEIRRLIFFKFVMGKGPVIRSGICLLCIQVLAFFLFVKMGIFLFFPFRPKDACEAVELSILLLSSPDPRYQLIEVGAGAETSILRYRCLVVKWIVQHSRCYANLISPLRRVSAPIAPYQLSHYLPILKFAPTFDI